MSSAGAFYTSRFDQSRHRTLIELDHNPPGLQPQLSETLPNASISPFICVCPYVTVALFGFRQYSECIQLGHGRAFAIRYIEGANGLVCWDCFTPLISVDSSRFTSRVPQLLLQHSSALRKRAVGLTYAYLSTSVEHSSLLTTIPQPNSETVPEVLTSVKCS